MTDTKNRTAEHASHLTAMAIELFGGLGFLEEYGIARWHREALITPIWEGPSNIQALDFLETIRKYRGHEMFLSEMTEMLTNANTFESGETMKLLQSTLSKLESLPATNAEWQAKHALSVIADAAQVALLYNLSQTDGHRYRKLATLYALFCTRSIQTGR